MKDLIDVPKVFSQQWIAKVNKTRQLKLTYNYNCLHRRCHLIAGIADI